MEFITYPSSGIEKIEDIKGKRMAFTSETSNSGYKAPSALMRDQFKMEAGKDFTPVFSGKHDNSILGVANKDYPAAAIANSVKAQMEAQLKTQMETQMQAERKKIYESRIKQISDSKRSYECAICYQEQSLSYSLSCSHTFCLPCIRALPPLPVPVPVPAKSSSSSSSSSNSTKTIKCPTCQVPTPLDDVRRSLLVDEQVEKLLREECTVLELLGRESEGKASLDRWLQEQAEKRAEEKAWIQEKQQQQQRHSAVVTAGPKKPAKDAKEKKGKAPKPQAVPVPAPAPRQPSPRQPAPRQPAPPT
jgi:hypothetical protein